MGTADKNNIILTLNECSSEMSIDKDKHCPQYLSKQESSN